MRTGLAAATGAGAAPGAAATAGGGGNGAVIGPVIDAVTGAAEATRTGRGRDRPASRRGRRHIAGCAWRRKWHRGRSCALRWRITERRARRHVGAAGAVNDMIDSEPISGTGGRVRTWCGVGTCCGVGACRRISTCRGVSCGRRIRGARRRIGRARRRVWGTCRINHVADRLLGASADGGRDARHQNKKTDDPHTPIRPGLIKYPETGRRALKQMSRCGARLDATTGAVRSRAPFATKTAARRATAGRRPPASASRRQR